MVFSTPNGRHFESDTSICPFIPKRKVKHLLRFVLESWFIDKLVDIVIFFLLVRKGLVVFHQHLSRLL